MRGKNKKKYTPDVLAIGAIAFAGSALTERLLLQPKTEVKIAEGFSVPVQGILPFSQKYIANIAKTALNNVLPVTMSASVFVMNRLRMREQFKKGVLWFLYDFLSRYSLNSVVTSFLGRFKSVNKGEYKSFLHDNIEKFISEKADRETLIKGITNEIVKILSHITEGTMASLIFNEKFADAASGAVAAAVDRFLADDAANRLTEYILKLASQIEDLTVSGFLTNVLGIGRVEMANLIDTAYDAILGPEIIRTVKEMKAGDSAYDLIMGVNYENAMKYVSETELMRINAASAMVAMSIYSFSKRTARRFYKNRDRLAGIRRGVNSLFSDKEFLGEDEE